MHETKKKNSLSSLWRRFSVRSACIANAAKELVFCTTCNVYNQIPRMGGM